MKKLKDDIRTSLNILTRAGVLSPEQLIQVLGAVDTEISAWSSEVSGKLQQMVVDWESSMGTLTRVSTRWASVVLKM